MCFPLLLWILSNFCLPGSVIFIFLEIFFKHMHCKYCTTTTILAFQWSFSQSQSCSRFNLRASYQQSPEQTSVTQVFIFLLVRSCMGGPGANRLPLHTLPGSWLWWRNAVNSLSLAEVEGCCCGCDNKHCTLCISQEVNVYHHCC